MKVIIIALLTIVLTGCSTIGELFQTNSPGQSTYRYEKTKDGCKLWLTDAKKIGEATLKIDKNCAVTTSGKAMDGNAAQSKMLDLINTQGVMLQRLIN